MGGRTFECLEAVINRYKVEQIVEGHTLSQPVKVGIFVTAAVCGYSYRNMSQSRACSMAVRRSLSVLWQRSVDVLSHTLVWVLVTYLFFFVVYFFTAVGVCPSLPVPISDLGWCVSAPHRMDGLSQLPVPSSDGCGCKCPLY